MYFYRAVVSKNGQISGMGICYINIYEGFSKKMAFVCLSRLKSLVVIPGGCIHSAERGVGLDWSCGSVRQKCN